MFPAPLSLSFARNPPYTSYLEFNLCFLSPLPCSTHKNLPRWEHITDSPGKPRQSFWPPRGPVGLKTLSLRPLSFPGLVTHFQGDLLWGVRQSQGPAKRRQQGTKKREQKLPTTGPQFPPAASAPPHGQVLGEKGQLGTQERLSFSQSWGHEPPSRARFRPAAAGPASLVSRTPARALAFPTLLLSEVLGEPSRISPGS